VNQLQRQAHHTNALPRNALQFLMVFAIMAAAEWQKLIAEVRHAFPRKRTTSTAIKTDSAPRREPSANSGTNKRIAR